MVMNKINELLGSPEKYDAMSKSLLGMAVPDSADRLCDVMQKLIEGKTRK